ncbi:TetR family transcriptional regulator [Erythrobacter sp. KY5]|uniref:TetR/AcrR family transcriptional regulator n=1 Tax=Erythrobacter sp. KY5 TaxID=2011159 RepID=UPI000DBEFC45|nr:TetR family transcriptional regulator [Erythrobacter sp. KY5]AWW73744.1 TetR family transcriptional regulator [Erythrobacter sp. KY5]
MNLETPVNQREKQRLKTRGEILDAALNIFAEKGFDATSVREIAGSVGVNHGLIRHHFTNKEELWKEAVALLFGRMEAELAIEPGSEDHLSEFDRLKNGIRRYVRYCARHPEHARIMVQQSIHGSERFKWMVEKFIAPLHRAGQVSREKYASQRLWPAINEISITYILVAASQMPFVLAQEIQEIYGLEPTEPEWVERHADAIIALFFEHSVNTD